MCTKWLHALTNENTRALVSPPLIFTSLSLPFSPSQLLRPLNTLDDLCRLMQSYVNVRPNAQGHPSGVSVLCVSSELCNRLGACHITMCGTGMQRSAARVARSQMLRQSILRTIEGVWCVLELVYSFVLCVPAGPP